MPKQEIPRDEWTAFMDSFSRRHAGWHVTIEVREPAAGPRIQARELPLQGITADLKGVGAISIIAGEYRNPALSRIVSQPTCVRLTQTEEGAYETLEIESANGATTVVRFRTAMLPENLDGLVNQHL